MKRDILAVTSVLGLVLLLCLGAANVGPPAYLLSQLSDVRFGTLTDGQAVIYNAGSSKFTNGTPSFTITNQNLTNWNKMDTNSAVWQNGGASNLTFYGLEDRIPYTNQYSTFTNIVLNPTNGPDQTILLTNNCLLSAIGNIAGRRRHIEVVVYAQGNFSVFFPPRAAGWFTVGTNTAGAAIALTNGQHMVIAHSLDNTNVFYGPGPVNN